MHLLTVNYVSSTLLSALNKSCDFSYIKKSTILILLIFSLYRLENRAPVNLIRMIVTLKIAQNN